MAAMERNSDLIKMQCYAPLLVNVNPGARQWRPNLIGYDAISAYGSPSYYAIQMFSRNLGDEILSTASAETSVQGCATRDSQTGEIFLKLVNPQTNCRSAEHSKSTASPRSPPKARPSRWPEIPTIPIRSPSREKLCLSRSTVRGVKPGFHLPIAAEQHRGAEIKSAAVKTPPPVK